MVLTLAKAQVELLQPMNQASYCLHRPRHVLAISTDGFTLVTITTQVVMVVAHMPETPDRPCSWEGAAQTLECERNRRACTSPSFKTKAVHLITALPPFLSPIGWLRSVNREECNHYFEEEYFWHFLSYLAGSSCPATKPSPGEAL